MDTRGAPVPPPLPTATWFNKPVTALELAAPEGTLHPRVRPIV